MTTLIIETNPAPARKARRPVLVFALLALFVGPANAGGAYEGQIDGEFHGWDGETIYKLMDGHIIQQSTYHYHYHYAYSPRVLIYQSGGYKIHVENDSDEDVGIRFLR